MHFHCCMRGFSLIFICDEGVLVYTKTNFKQATCFSAFYSFFFQFTEVETIYLRASVQGPDSLPYESKLYNKLQMNVNKQKM